MVCATHGYGWCRAKRRPLVFPEQNPKVTDGTPGTKDVVLKTPAALNPAMFLNPSARNQHLQSNMDSFGSIQFPAKVATMHCNAPQFGQAH